MVFRPRKPLAMRIFLMLCCLSLLLSGVPGAPSLPTRAASISPSFSVSEFEQLWKRTDDPVAQGLAARSWLWGPSPGASLSEPYEQGTGGTRTVQYFDKARMELNPAVTDPSSMWHVTTGLLVSEMVQGRVQTGDNQFDARWPSTEAVAGDNGVSGNPRYSDFTGLATKASTDRTGQPVSSWLAPGTGTSTGPDGGVKYAAFVSATGHNVPDVFLTYMAATGAIEDSSGNMVTGPLFDWVYVMGYPITEPYWVNIKVSGTQHTALVQLYQRRVLTYVPDFAPGWQVQMGNAGQAYYDWRYKTQAPASPAATPAAAQPTATPAGGAAAPLTFPATGSFVGISGDSFTYKGSNIK